MSARDHRQRAADLAGILSARYGDAPIQADREDGGITGRIFSGGRLLVTVRTGPGRSAIVEALLGIYPERPGQ